MNDAISAAKKYAYDACYPVTVTKPAKAPKKAKKEKKKDTVEEKVSKAP